MINFATFEVLDDDFVNEEILGQELNEEEYPFFALVHFDSKKFFRIVGLPLYAYLMYIHIKDFIILYVP